MCRTPTPFVCTADNYAFTAAELHGSGRNKVMMNLRSVVFFYLPREERELTPTKQFTGGGKCVICLLGGYLLLSSFGDS